MKTKRGLNGCVLKWIAIILMTIDQFGASILENFLLNVWDVSPLGDLLRDYPDYWDLVLMADWTACISCVLFLYRGRILPHQKCEKLCSAAGNLCTDQRSTL